MEFKELWDLDSAMQVLTSSSVDAKLWAEAVEWLLLYGPAEIRDILLAASSTATASAFPQLKPSHFTPDGKPVYNIRDLAANLNISEEEARKVLEEKLKEDSVDPFSSEEGPGTIH